MAAREASASRVCWPRRRPAASATSPDPATTPAVRSRARRPESVGAASSRSTSLLSTIAPRIAAIADGSTETTVASGRVAAHRPANAPMARTT